MDNDQAEISPPLSGGEGPLRSDARARWAALERSIVSLKALLGVARWPAVLPFRARLASGLERVGGRVPLVGSMLKMRFQLGGAAQDCAAPVPARTTPVGFEHVPDARRVLADRHLAGDGLEIGALHNPLPLPAAARVCYVDRLTLAEARIHYPELAQQPLVEPGIIAECDQLTPVVSGSVDFVVANHVLEHVRNPFGALREWLRVLRPGGCLYVAVPDRANPIDRLRPVTTFEHLLSDADGSTAGVDRPHYEEWVRANSPDAPATEQLTYAGVLEQKGYAIHFHVFDRALFERVVEHITRESDASLIEFVTNPAHQEHIAVIRLGQSSPAR
jgi:SAM-dependent methyltransferase